MIDLKKWAKDSPVATWAAFLFTILMAINGLANGVIDGYSKISSLIEDDSLIAVVGRADFQPDKYDLVEIDFRNPTKSTKTISDVSLLCNSFNGLSWRIYAANNTPKEWNIFKDLELTPVSIRPGEARKVALVFYKNTTIGNSLHTCASVTPAWTGSEFKEQKGDTVLIPGNAVTFTNTTLNRS